MFRYIYLSIFLVILFSCNKDENLNSAPEAEYAYADNIDEYIFYSLASDKDEDSLSHLWSSTHQEIVFLSPNEDTTVATIPDFTNTQSIEIKLQVWDQYHSSEISKLVDFPSLTTLREWGLGRELIEKHNNDVSYDWYIDQRNTGVYYYENCGPTVVTMAIKWADSTFCITPVDARETYVSSGGWWYTSDITAYLDDYSINNYIINLSDSKAYLKEELDNGNIAILCLDMYYVSRTKRDKWHCDKFYSTNKKGWGHFILVKGYLETDNKFYFETYDPYSMEQRYSDKTLMGKDRYYSAKDLNNATNKWWDYAIIVSRNKQKSSRLINKDMIEHKSGS